MKNRTLRLLTLLLFLAQFPIVVSAQRILNISDLPSGGDNFYRYEIPLIVRDAETYNAIKNDTGLNIVWDYRTWTPIYRQTNPPLQYHSQSFPGYPYTNNNNLAMGNDTSSFLYLEKTNNAIYLNTQRSSYDNYYVTYTSPLLLFYSYLNYGATVSDSCNYYTNGSFVGTSKANVRIKYDGFGTLKLDTLVFDSVIRYSTNYIKTVKSFDSGKNMDVYNKYDHITHQYFRKGLHFPVLSVDFTFSRGDEEPYDTTYIQYYVEYFNNNNTGSLGIGDLVQQQFDNDLYVGKGALHFSQALNTSVNVNIYDMNGKILFTKKNVPINTNSIELPIISNGNYIVKVDQIEGKFSYSKKTNINNR